VGNTHLLEKRMREREEAEKHERNKDEWYRRQEKLEMQESGGYVEANLKKVCHSPGLGEGIRGVGLTSTLSTETGRGRFVVVRKI